MVPVGEDQASHLELSREIGRRFNHLYGDIFPEPKALFPPPPRVPGLDGRKMSKSYKNTIDLADTPEEIKKKCSKMFTDPSRIKRSDPGHPETCNLFEFHKLFSSPELQEKVQLECRRAQIGCVDDKKLVAEQIISALEPIREKRENFLRDRSTLIDILHDGSRRAASRAEETMESVRSALSVQQPLVLRESLR